MTKKRNKYKAQRKAERKRRKKVGIEKKKKRAMWKRRKMNRLNVFKRKSNRRNISYQFYSKSRSFSANFSNVNFKHVNFKGAILTKCSFKNATFVGVEFWGTNLKKSNFTNANFKHCVFVGTHINDTNFKNTTFEHCIFVNTNIGVSKNLNIDCQGIRVMSNYPEIDLSDELKEAIKILESNEHIRKYKIIHLGGNKLNLLNIMLLLERLGEKNLILGLNYASSNVKKDMPTISCMFNYLFKNKGEYVII